MVSQHKQLTLDAPFSGRLRRVGDEARNTERENTTLNNTTPRMPVFCWKEFLELQSPREGHGRLEVVFIYYFTEIPHWGYTQ